MAENLLVDKSLTKESKYQALIPQLKNLLVGENDIIANYANIAAALRQTFDFFWVGFYRVLENELVLGPFQGTIACTRIRYGKGVCGTAWKEEKTLIVPNVNEFPGHIACDATSQSEIVIPVFVQNRIIAVLDIDSQYLNHFDDIDAYYLKQIVELLP